VCARGEVEWAGFAARTPHYVFSSTLSSAQWSKTRFLRSVDDVAALKQQSGKDIYLIGGARTTASLIDAGLVDELRRGMRNWPRRSTGRRSG
jgi:dihydrofolate reductase